MIDLKSAIPYNLLLILCVITPASAQRKIEPVKSNQERFKYDLSLDVFQLLVNHQVTTMFRYAPRPNGAYRVRLAGGVDHSEYTAHSTPGSPTTNSFTTNVFNLTAGLGYEFQKTSNRFQFFYGPEISGNRQKGKYEYSAGYAGSQIGPPDIYNLRIGGFAGVKYFVLKRLSLSAEANLHNSWSKINLYDPSDNNIQVGDAKSRGLSFILVEFLNVSFHF